LIDDIIHSGTTILRQLEILKTVNKKPDFVFTIVDYKKNDNKEMLLKMGVNLQSVYYLNEIIPQDADINESKLNEGFDVMWKFSAPDPNFFHRIHKSTPLLDQNTIFFASDNHTLWSLNKNDGSIQWAFKGFGYPTRSKMTVFSSPAIYNNIIYIASYDGNLYALNKNNGIKKWVYLDADFIGSSPVIADKLNMLFIGIGYGLFNKKGAIVALNAESGKRIWHFNTPNFILSTPYYCREKKIIVVGCDDGVIYAFYAKNGKKLWQFQTEGSVRSFLDYDPKKQIIFAGSFDDYLYGLNINTGELKFKFKTKGPVFSPPLVYENNIYFGSMDKHLYCVNLDTELANWNFDAGGRIFAKPKIVNDKIYIGSTSGILYEIELLTGKALSYFIATERITNEIVFDRKERKFFLSTYANELYCLSKKQKNN
jgi:outer membrane protein assembly factor BamB